jgi:hypothetical protein
MVRRRSREHGDKPSSLNMYVPWWCDCVSTRASSKKQCRLENVVNAWRSKVGKLDMIWGSTYICIGSLPRSVVCDIFRGFGSSNHFSERLFSYFESVPLGLERLFEECLNSAVCITVPFVPIAVAIAVAVP